MDNTKIIESWLSAFADGVDDTAMESYVLSEGNHLWHIFSWELVPCLEGDAARAAFDSLDYKDAIKFTGGYSNSIDAPSEIGKISSKSIDDCDDSDVYITDKDFTWTYVRTHEREQCGPYFCVKR